MKKYSLGLVGWRVDNLDSARDSVEMLMAGLETEFKKLSHVELHIFPLSWAMEDNPEIFFNSIPTLDFMLIHCYNSFPVVKKIDTIKHKIKYEICSFMECPQKKMDYTFGYIKKFNPNQYIAYPYCKQFMINVPKIPKTILLDNTLTKGFDISKKLAKWLECLTKEGYKIYQLTKKETVAQFVEPMIICKYKEYMEKTAQIETFIQVHSGSYEHSIIDMTGRGIRALIPIKQPEFPQEPSFLPKEIIDGLELDTFSTQSQLLDLIKHPVEVKILDNKINKMTEMKEVVKIMDVHFQTILNKNA